MNMGTLKKEIIFGLEARMYVFGLVFSDMISMIPKKIYDKYIYNSGSRFHQGDTNFETGVIK